mmetsp:Transcript_23872/g.36093  ORF Transcript_23872/g.36093 Transcript_23872/m.36093 type:complete len:88 (+) Transcript_23872:100-363(+)
MTDLSASEGQLLRLGSARLGCSKTRRTLAETLQDVMPVVEAVWIGGIIITCDLQSRAPELDPRPMGIMMMMMMMTRRGHCSEHVHFL